MTHFKLSKEDVGNLHAIPATSPCTLDVGAILCICRLIAICGHIWRVEYKEIYAPNETRKKRVCEVPDHWIKSRLLDELK